MKIFLISKVFIVFVFLIPNINFSQETFLDEFNAISYSGNNGSVNFYSDWIEVNDPAPGPSSGVILVVSDALRLRNVDNAYIYRELDLSGSTSVTFTLDYDATGARGEFLELYFYDDATGNYEFHSLINTANDSGSISIPLSGSLVSVNSGVSFRGDGVWAANAEIFVDNVKFTATFEIDSDGDTIVDSLDLDDDNDGILDDLECDATGTSLGDSNTISQIIYFQDFEDLPRLDAPLLNDGSEGFTTDLFHFSGENSSLGVNINTVPAWNATPGAVPDGSEYMIASDIDGTPGNGNILWNIATNGTVPAILPSVIGEPSGDFFLVNSFSDITSSYNSNSMFTLDDNDGDGNTGEIFSVDNIILDRNGVYDFAVFITDITNVGNNNNFYNFEVFDAVSGGLIATVTNGILPLDDQWHLISLEFFITNASFSVGNTNREVNLVFRQNTDLGSGADIGIDNVFLAYRALDTDEDGIANCEDLDSDGDGCPDAYEGSGAFTDINLVSDPNLNGGSTDVLYNLGVGTDTDNDGLLDIVEPLGQGLGSSIDNLTSNCPLVINFDGVDDVIKAPSGFNISGWNAITIQFWAKTNTIVQTNAGIIGQEGVIEITHSGNVSCKLFSQGTEKNFNSPTWLSNTSKWEHFTLVYNQGTTQIYQNGVKLYEDVDLSLGQLENSSNTFNIGGLISSSGVSNFFNGWIDEVRVFDIALTETQIQQMVYQEIENNGGYVHGVVIPKDIEDVSTGNKISWSNLRLYYKMNDSFINRQVEDVSQFAENGSLFNIYTQQQETAPIPYIANNAGVWSSPTTWLHGDVWDIDDVLNNKDWSIVRVSSNVTASHDIITTGLLIDSGVTLSILGDHKVENSSYLELNGTLDLQDDSQLIQTEQSDLVTSATGKILRRQEGTANAYWYNYWSSPVGITGVTTLTDNNTALNNANNSPFNLNMLKDETENTVQFTSNYTANGNISTYWLYTYTNGLNYWDWAQISTGTALSPGVGYTQKGTGIPASEQQYIFEGKPNNGTILVSVSDVGGPGSVTNVSKTEYLLGNPYPSALDIHKFIDDNQGVIKGSLQLWQQWSGSSHNLNDYNGGYAQVNKTGSIRASQFISFYGANTGLQEGAKIPTRYLPVSQGFIAEIENDGVLPFSGTVVFNNSQRVFIKEADANPLDNQVGSVFSKSLNGKTLKGGSSEETAANNEMKKIRLEFNSTSGTATRRELLLGFSNYTSDSFDYGYDAESTSISNNDLNLDFEGKDMNIQAYSEITQDKVVPLNFKSSGSNTFEIKITELENIDKNQEVYLKDNQTGIYFNLREGNAYQFTSEQGKFNTRFELVFQNKEQSLSVEESLAKDNFIYYKNSEHKLFVKKLNVSVAKLSLVNMLGQTVLEFNDVSQENLNNGLSISNITSGSYIAYFRTEDQQVLTKKIIVN